MTKHEQIILDFLKPLIPSDWRPELAYNYERDYLQITWYWTDINGTLKACPIQFDTREMFVPELDPYQKSLYVLAHREDPPTELSDYGKTNLRMIAYAAVKSSQPK